MANFVRCFDGSWINLDHIAKIDRIKDSKRYRFITSTGEEAGEAEIDFDPAYATPILPALPGEALFEFYARSTERQPTSFEDIVTIETPILGWHCSLPRAKPITYRPYIDRGASMYLYRMADGRLTDEWQGTTIFENFDAAKVYVLERIRSQWD